MSRIQMKRAWGIAMAVILIVALAACSGSKEKTGSTESSVPSEKAQQDSKPVKLRITWWGSQARHDATLKALDLYTKKYPNVTFEPEFSGFDGYLDKLSTQAAAGNAPDVIQFDAAWLNDWASRNQLADLSSGIRTEDIDSSLLDSGKYNGKLFAVPLGNNAWGMIYDKTALEKLAAAAPKPDWTWNDFFNLAREIKPKLGKGQYVLADGTSDYNLFASYQLSKGKGWPITADGKFNFDKDTWLEYQGIFEQFRKDGIVPPPDVQVSNKDLDPNLDLLATGKILFKTAFAAQSTGYDSLKPGSYAMVPMPKDSQAGGYLKASMYWSVSVDSDKQEEAKRFIDWFINDPEAGEILGTTRGIPVAKSVLSSIKPKLTPADQMGIDMINETAPTAQTFTPTAKGWNNFQIKDFKDTSEKLLFSKIDANEAFDELLNMSKEYEQ